MLVEDVTTFLGQNRNIIIAPGKSVDCCALLVDCCALLVDCCALLLCVVG